ncbi:hypothetical protein L596_026795 [Steinernema carpocapsae]|uniref:Uncharacterized protein n=1 Tax=Steinernema carpocapsae TaxID=34508 RepID=A0A4U5M3D0_STECR|nr:hypothetical protein L596_026795 [Steinernema carpocapsae]
MTCSCCVWILNITNFLAEKEIDTFANLNKKKRTFQVNVTEGVQILSTELQFRLDNHVKMYVKLVRMDTNIHIASKFLRR